MAMSAHACGWRSWMPIIFSYCLPCCLETRFLSKPEIHHFCWDWMAAKSQDHLFCLLITSTHSLCLFFFFFQMWVLSIYTFLSWQPFCVAWVLQSYMPHVLFYVVWSCSLICLNQLIAYVIVYVLILELAHWFTCLSWQSLYVAYVGPAVLHASGVTRKVVWLF